jgi:uncharacterized protein YbjT (DUF2867 family)
VRRARAAGEEGAADTYVQSREGLDWTILRPGRLTDRPGTGLVRLAGHTGRGEVPRDDVAAVLAEILRRPGTVGRVLELVGGTVPVEEAVKAAASGA